MSHLKAASPLNGQITPALPSQLVESHVLQSSKVELKYASGILGSGTKHALMGYPCVHRLIW